MPGAGQIGQLPFPPATGQFRQPPGPPGMGQFMQPPGPPGMGPIRQPPGPPGAAVLQYQPGQEPPVPGLELAGPPYSSGEPLPPGQQADTMPNHLFVSTGAQQNNNGAYAAGKISGPLYILLCCLESACTWLGSVHGMPMTVSDRICGHQQSLGSACR